MPFSLSPLAAALSLFAIPSRAAVQEDDVVFVGKVVAEATSVSGFLDAPKLSPVSANETSYDWYEKLRAAPSIVSLLT